MSLERGGRKSRNSEGAFATTKPRVEQMDTKEDTQGINQRRREFLAAGAWKITGSALLSKPVIGASQVLGGGTDTT